MALLQFNDLPRGKAPRYPEASHYLSQADPVLDRLIRAIGPCTLMPRRNYFAVLCDSIIAQQISTQVAAVVFGRFRSLFPHHSPSPPIFLRIPKVALQGVGLSRQKLSYLHGLAQAFDEGRIIPNQLWRLEDEEIITQLVAIRGIGRWTAEMFLIFSLNRLNVLPLGDFGIQKAIQQCYRFRTSPTPGKIQTLGKAWEPYRTIASWYLWASLHN